MALIYGRFGPGRSEIISGTPENDDIHPLGGDDVIDGGRGIDRVHVEARSTDFRITTVSGTTYLDATTGASTGKGVTLKNVETVVFQDRTVSLVIHDRLINTTAADLLDGGPGTDSFFINAPRAAYGVSADFTSATVKVNRLDGSEGSDFLTSVERLRFTEGRGTALDLGVHEPAGQAVLLIGAVLGKSLLPFKEELMGTVIGLFDEGFTLQQLAGALLRLPIWGGVLTPTNSAQDIARHLLRTVHRSDPTDQDAITAAAALAGESPEQQGTWLAALAASSVNQIQVDLIGLQRSGFQYTVIGVEG